MRRRDFLLQTAAAVALADAPAFAQQAKPVTMWHIYNNESDMIHLGIKKFHEAQRAYRVEQRLVPYVQINPELIRAIATG